MEPFGKTSLVLLLLSLFLFFGGCEKSWHSPLDFEERQHNAIQLPTISDLFPSAITTNSTMILWKTLKPADSTVTYGESSPASTVLNDPAYVVEHAMTLKDLKPGTTYYFLAASKDSLGNSVSSSEMTFVTEALGNDALGPVVSNFSVSPTPTAGAAVISISATISDTTTGGSPVASAECFIDTQGENGTGTVISAQNGAFDTSSEIVTEVINIEGLSIGTHKVYIHGKDALNNWGDFQSADLLVTAGSSSDTTGPEISNLTIAPNPTTGALSAAISASLSDAATGGALIVAAEYFIDTQGTNGSGITLNPQDGFYDSAIESINGTVNVGDLNIGTHKIYVHGKDALNNWGSFQSVDIAVTAGNGTDTNGPLVSNFTITPNPTAGATTVSAAATVSDTGTGGSNVIAAEYFVDSSGTNDTGSALSAQDGTFNSTTETVSASISTSELSAGSHRIYVHGKDAKNNWGAYQYLDLVVSAAAVTKPDTNSATTISFGLSNPKDHSTEAIWIEDSTGKFIRTLFVGSYADSHQNFLPTWDSVSVGKTDGTTGATKSAGSYNLNWKPCKASGSTTVVSPGTYRYRIEYREEGGTPSVYTGTITLGENAASSTGTSGGKVSSLSGVYLP